MILDDICVFDFETSGLDHQNDRVIELAAIRVKNGKVVHEFSTIVRQPIVIEAKITELTGITQDEVDAGMDEMIAFKVLRQIMSEVVLVAHNAVFDLQFLHWTMMRLAQKTFSNPFFDTMSICRDRFIWTKDDGHRLEGMCRQNGIELAGAHRALNDVYGCFELLKALHAERPVDDWLNRLGYLSKYPAPAWVPDYANSFPTMNKYA